MWSNATYPPPRAASRPRVHKPPSAPACARSCSRQGNAPKRGILSETSAHAAVYSP
eukprot:CAMPEP_0195071814 /NCGR_PEP_ID=MMETSP0448-20130528/15522_1 /TAXON_ID=66468 /ORGANISM="Heterocapsa triquestra, Strain CCMP 448" /LENGTH=55 /DNA_ID=CAMNT_0040103713 /DNA_START=31 /DNA_END=194 /DNA_ORIENTATION=+